MRRQRRQQWGEGGGRKAEREGNMKMERKFKRTKRGRGKGWVGTPGKHRKRRKEAGKGVRERQVEGDEENREDKKLVSGEKCFEFAAPVTPQPADLVTWMVLEMSGNSGTWPWDYLPLSHRVTQGKEKLLCSSCAELQHTGNTPATASFVRSESMQLKITVKCCGMDKGNAICSFIWLNWDKEKPS